MVYPRFVNQHGHFEQTQLDSGHCSMPKGQSEQRPTYQESYFCLEVKF